MSGKDILNAFHFDVSEEPVSIYPFSPVYKTEQNGKSYIVKKTRSPIEKANRLVHFIEKLKNNGVSVVTPVPLSVDNPQQINDSVWVVYPFINGKKYTGGDKEIYEAGKLLGQIHSLSSGNNEDELDHYDEFDFEVQEIEEDLGAIQAYADDHGMSFDFDYLKSHLLKVIQRQNELEQLALPSVATPHDYKANNLIYNHCAEPFLIDPDNAVFLPRIYDLALALLLFHNELDTAPPQMFDLKQWSLFKKGYFEFVTVTDVEKEIWQDVLNHVYLDEVIWLMAEFEEDWDIQNQIGLYKSLFSFLADTEKYELE